jgi:alanyl-tRNA synthetase
MPLTRTSQEIRNIFLDFFKKKGHQVVPSSSLVPVDKSVLLTSAGMQQFIPYLSGKKDPLKDFGSRHLTSIQKCFRTIDLDQVGDDTHNTFFEMLGNWSIGQDPQKGYFKEGAIALALEFFEKELGWDKNNFYITVFKGAENISPDHESLEIWQKNGIPRERIKEFGLKDNFWIAGNTGPCGPCSEIHYDRGEKYGCGNKNCGPNCPYCQRFVEIWNLVFMEYEKKEDGSYLKLPQKNVDTGVGFERLVALLQKKDSVFETDLFLEVINKIEEISQKKYQAEKRNFRIIADHVRGAVFLIADKVLPSNIGTGYILRRVLRRAMRYGKILDLPKDFLIPLGEEIIKKYEKNYPQLRVKQSEIITVIQKEQEKFSQTLEKGLKEFSKLTALNKKISGAEAFNLYQSYGFPFEFTEELAQEKGFKIDKKAFIKAATAHQEISRAGAEAKFGGIGHEADKQAIKFHTATHLLHRALREVLGEHVQQMGSDINSQRLRFDFSHPAKMTAEEIKKVEEIVNQKIKEDLKVVKELKSYQQAIDSGALAFFKEKYPVQVTVYSIGNFSKEICAGPHVDSTLELGNFKIIKEASSGAGVRRIKAILE